MAGWISVTMETMPATCPGWWLLQNAAEAFFASSPYSHLPPPMNKSLAESLYALHPGVTRKKKQSCPTVGRRPLLLSSYKLLRLCKHQFPHL